MQNLLAGLLAVILGIAGANCEILSTIDLQAARDNHAPARANDSIQASTYEQNGNTLVREHQIPHIGRYFPPFAIQTLFAFGIAIGLQCIGALLFFWRWAGLSDGRYYPTIFLWFTGVIAYTLPFLDWATYH